MRVILNEQGYVHEYAIVGKFGVPSLVVREPDDIEDFEKNYQSYCLSADMQLVKNHEKQAEIENELALKELRIQREKACFPYINRGYLWYSKLTDAQKEELSSWYQAWLDVTETKNIPTTPAWLKI